MKLPRAKLYLSASSLLLAVFKLLLKKGERGNSVKVLESKLSNFWSIKYCKLLSSCRLGLFYSLRALNLKPGDEVLLTPLTIPDVVNAIHVLGLKPVFIEMSPDDHNLLISDLKSKINSKSRVLLVTYLSGIVPDMNQIIDIVKKNNLIVIEDISQVYGATFNGHLIGTFGKVAIGSFSLGKTIASLAGGFILTNDEKVYIKINSLCSNEFLLPSRSFLAKQAFSQIKIVILTSRFVFNYFTYYVFLFYSRISKSKFDRIHDPRLVSESIRKDNFYENKKILRNDMPADIFIRFTDIQATLALHSFNKLEDGLEKRKALAKVLFNNLDEVVKTLIPSFINKHHKENSFWHFPIVINGNVKEFQSYLLKNGFDTVGYALCLCSNEQCFMLYHANLINSKYIKENTTFLPIHDDFVFEDMEKLATAVNRYFQEV